MDIGFIYDQDKHRFDIALDGGDLKQDATGIVSALITSLFTVLGSAWSDPEWGSRLYTLKRAKRTDETLRLAKIYAEQSTQWIVDDGLLASIDITTEFAVTGQLLINVAGTLPDGSEYFEVFNYSLEG